MRRKALELRDSGVSDIFAAAGSDGRLPCPCGPRARPRRYVLERARRRPRVDAALILQVVTSPSRAFARMGGDHLYQAAGVLAVASVIGVLPALPLASVPLPPEYQESLGQVGLPSDAASLAWYAVTSIAAGLISAALFYAGGALLGGSRDWRRVFAVMLHVNVLAAVVALLLAGPAFLMASEFASADLGSLEEAGPEEAADLLGPLLGYLALVLLIVLGAAVWLTVVSVKAVKSAHGFGTAKSFGLVVLVGIATVLASYPLG